MSFGYFGKPAGAGAPARAQQAFWFNRGASWDQSQF